MSLENVFPLKPLTFEGLPWKGHAANKDWRFARIDIVNGYQITLTRWVNEDICTMGVWKPDGTRHSFNVIDGPRLMEFLRELGDLDLGE